MTSSSQEDGPVRPRPPIGETIIGAGVLVLAIVMFWQTMSIPVSPIYAKVGPTVVPMMTATALGLLASSFSSMPGKAVGNPRRRKPSSRTEQRCSGSLPGSCSTSS